MLSLEQEAEKAPIAFDDKGDMRPNRLTLKLEAYEALPKGSTFNVSGEGGGIDLSLVGERPRPEGLDGKKSDEDVLAQWDKVGAYA
jgi:hypothetical protein